MLRIPDSAGSGVPADVQNLTSRKNIGKAKDLLQAMLLPVGNDERADLGILVCVFSRNAGKSSWFDPKTLYDVLSPALAILAESVTLNDQVGKLNGRVDSVERELTLL